MRAGTAYILEEVLWKPQAPSKALHDHLHYFMALEHKVQHLLSEEAFLPKTFPHTDYKSRTQSTARLAYDPSASTFSTSSAGPRPATVGRTLEPRGSQGQQESRQAVVSEAHEQGQMNILTDGKRVPVNGRALKGWS